MAVRKCAQGLDEGVLSRNHLSASSACHHLNPPGTHRTVSFALRARQEESFLRSSRGSEGSPHDKPRPLTTTEKEGTRQEERGMLHHGASYLQDPAEYSF